MNNLLEIDRNLNVQSVEGDWKPFKINLAKATGVS